MSRFVILLTGLLATLLFAAGWHRIQSSKPAEIPFEPANKPPAPAPLCPWREPEHDLKLFFPEATRYELQTSILSGLRTELTERLGRVPTGDENVLHRYRVYQDTVPLGSILTRRVKGSFGAIELVLALETNNQARAVRVQRLREPEPIAAALQDQRWLNAFSGRRSQGNWELGRDIPDVPPAARPSAEAMIQGARSLLVLAEVAEHAATLAARNAHHR